jgi:hypothetical protein
MLHVVEPGGAYVVLMLGALHTMAVKVHGQRFELWTWPLEASHYARPKAPLTIFHWLSISNPFLWTLNKVWPLNPTASQLGPP